MDISEDLKYFVNEVCVGIDQHTQQIVSDIITKINKKTVFAFSKEERFIEFRNALANYMKRFDVYKLGKLLKCFNLEKFNIITKNALEKYVEKISLMFNMTSDEKIKPINDREFLKNIFFDFCRKIYGDSSYIDYFNDDKKRKLYVKSTISQIIVINLDKHIEFPQNFTSNDLIEDEENDEENEENEEDEEEIEGGNDSMDDVDEEEEEEESPYEDDFDEDDIEDDDSEYDEFEDEEEDYIEDEEDLMFEDDEEEEEEKDEFEDFEEEEEEFDTEEYNEYMDDYEEMYED